MELAYTITSGTISVKEKCCDIPFALVFEEEGVYFVETFLKEKDFFSEEISKYYFSLIGKTKKGYKIEITGLAFRKYEYENQRIELECQHCIKLTDYRKEPPESELDRIYGQRLWFIELEGLNMTFSDSSEVIKYVANEKQEIIKFDHTSCSLHLDLDSGNPGNHIHMVFYKNPANGNILIDFTKQKGYSYLNFEYYNQIKNDLIHVLSFINGASVSIKRELTGKTYRSNASNAQIVYIYSYRNTTNRSSCNFVPINEHRNYSHGIFRDIFLICFKKYLSLNTELDLNSLVISLNNSFHANSLEDRFFILITAFEKIANLSHRKNNKQESTIIDSEYFKDHLKKALIVVLKQYINDTNTKEFLTLNSRLGGLNNSKYETARVLIDFLAYSKIPLNEKVSYIVVLRNRAVHEGFIGATDEEKLENYFILDNILRDCLLNIIGYSCYRKRFVKYFDKSEMLHKEPNIFTVY